MAERSRHPGKTKIGSRRGLFQVAASLVVAAGLLTSGAVAAEEAAAPLAPGVAGDDSATVYAAPGSPQARFGVAMRSRYVSVPGWLLDAFSDVNQPLSTYGLGAELFWRDKNEALDIAIGVNYLRMSPPDGNWLGAGNDPAVDTDFLQFRNVALWALDATVTWRTPLHRNFGLHYGVGLGMAVVTGKLLRTSASGCTSDNAKDSRACRPIICPATGCTEAILKASEGELDYPEDPHRHTDDNLPGAVPILHVVTGVHARHPRLPGFEARLEGGFYDALFLGLGVAYLF